MIFTEQIGKIGSKTMNKGDIVKFKKGGNAKISGHSSQRNLNISFPIGFEKEI